MKDESLSSHISHETRGLMYYNFNIFSGSHKYVGRLLAFPVAVTDIAVETCRYPMESIEHVARGSFHLFGSLFSSKCSLRKGIVFFQKSAAAIVKLPIAILFAPTKVIFQAFVILRKPSLANPYDIAQQTYKQESVVKEMIEERRWRKAKMEQYSKEILSIACPVIC